MPEIDEKTLATTAKTSVREFYPGTWGGLLGDGMGFLYPSAMDLLPGWGTPDCDRALRVLHYTQQNALWSGAFNIWKQKFLSTPYEISGGRNLTYQWQDIFFESDFGEGYDFMMDKALTDYGTLNRGLFIEKVAYGETDTPLKPGTRILGLNHLDAMRMIITGNREYPYLYFSEYTGQMHRMHYTRVVHIAQSPSPDTFLYGMGKSMLYDALTVANAQILLGRMQNELLSDMPPPGLVIFNNIKGEQVVQALDQFESQRNRDGQSVYRAPLHLQSLNPAEPATVTFVPLAQVPSDFDYDKYMRNHVNLLALTMGLDPQDIWPLATHALGSGAQSTILSQKTSGKGPGYLLTRMERLWNTVLPRPLEWKYKASNSQQGLEEAQIASTWTDILQKANFMTDDEKRMLAANQIEAFKDVLFDESGDLIRLDDKDPKDQQQEIMLDDSVEATVPNENAVTSTDTTSIDTNASTELAPLKDKALPAKPAPKMAIKPMVTKQPPVNNAVNNKFKEVQEQLDAGLITMSQAQQKLGVTVDPLYEGMYLIEGFPVPRENVRDLWQAHFGRGVASFDAVVSGTSVATQTGGTVPPSPNDTSTEPPPVEKAHYKEIGATESAFISEIQAAMQDGIDGVVTKASTAARIRGAITRYGKLAYIDGLEVGGVTEDEMTEDDFLVIADKNVEDSVYVSDLVNEIYSEAGMSGTPETRAPKWLSTLDDFYYAGIASADRNGMYEFTGDDGQENCDTCASLKGTKHRMKWWVDHELRPGIDHHMFDCGTFYPNCQHYLEKVAK